jgi:plastocyanin
MRRIATVPLLALLLGLAACSGTPSSTPGASTPVVASAAAPAVSAASAATSSGGAAASAAASAPGSAACAAAPAGAAATVTVTIKDFKYAPQPVQAKVGDVIAWSNQDSAPHSATLDAGACDTKTINPGAQAMLVFNAPGTYTYHCSVHPTQMKDYSIEVK